MTDSAYLGSESTYSECETFTDEDTGALVPPEMHEDVETDSGIEATLHDPEDGSNRLVYKFHVSVGCYAFIYWKKKKNLCVCSRLRKLDCKLQCLESYIIPLFHLS